MDMHKDDLPDSPPEVLQYQYSNTCVDTSYSKTDKLFASSLTHLEEGRLQTHAKLPVENSHQDGKQTAAISPRIAYWIKLVVLNIVGNVIGRWLARPQRPCIE
jgi:hypothetical protein